MSVHPSAIVENGAVIGEGTVIGPFSYIGPNVRLGRNNKILSHAVVDGHTVIGDDNTIFQFASVGAIPQDLKYHGEASQLIMGDRNIIREYATLQPGTEGGGMITKIGSKNLFMASTHIGHDSTIGDGNIFANCATIAGHVTIGNRANLGGLVGVHQFVRVGDFAIAAAGAMMSKDVPPYCMVHGDHARVVSINKIGLERAGFSADEIVMIRSLFKRVYFGDAKLKHEPFRSRLGILSKEFHDNPKAMAFLSFFESSKRGVTFPTRGIDAVEA